MNIPQQLKLVDFVSAALIAQGVKSEGAAGLCLYRGWNGAKCGIGMLIADEHYVPSLECVGPHEDLMLNALAASGWLVGPDDERFLHAVQNVHDRNGVAEWPKAFAELRANVTAGGYA